MCRISAAGWVLLVLTATSSSHAGAAPPAAEPAPLLASTPGQPLTLTVGSKVQVASVTREGLSDGEVSLRRSPGRLAGHVGIDPLEVQLEPGRVSGTLGDDPVGLDVVRSRGGLQVAGTFGRQSVAMEIRRDGIEAQIGPCLYRLPFTLGRYRGVVACGAAPVAAELTVPVALVTADDRDLAVMLTALLAR